MDTTIGTETGPTTTTETRGTAIEITVDSATLVETVGGITTVTTVAETLGGTTIVTIVAEIVTGAMTGTIIAMGAGMAVGTAK